MKALVFLAASLSLSAFAGSKDLRTMNTLLKIGVQSEQFMSQTHVGAGGVECYYSRISREAFCTLKDLSVDQGQGDSLNLFGAKASRLLELLVARGARFDQGMGKFSVGVKSIQCSQSAAGVGEGSAAARTLCSFEF